MRCYFLSSYCSKLQPRLPCGVNWSCPGAGPEAYRLLSCRSAALGVLPIVLAYLCLPTYVCTNLYLYADPDN